MATYLVTGGAGFIGSHIVDSLIDDGHTVLVIDNISTGKREHVNPKAKFIEADFTDFDQIKNHFKGVEGVFHAGALPRIPYSVEFPIESAQANIMGTLNVFVAARDAGVKRIVYSASSSAYGAQEELPLRPDMPANPLNPYALHKYVGEKFAEQFNRFYGMETVSLRYFNVYGPRMADEGAYVTVISHFMRQKKAGESLTIHGDGEQTRDFTHVFDVVRANRLAMSSPHVGSGDVLNVGAGEQYSVNDIAAMIGGPVVHEEGRVGEARHTLADISLVGPRPERPEFVEPLVERVPYYSLRHLTRPGLTGWAQVTFLTPIASLEDNLKKLQYDLYYIKHRSPLLDFIILLRTIGIILRRQGT